MNNSFWSSILLPTATRALNKFLDPVLSTIMTIFEFKSILINTGRQYNKVSKRLLQENIHSTLNQKITNLLKLNIPKDKVSKREFYLSVKKRRGLQSQRKCSNRYNSCFGTMNSNKNFMVHPVTAKNWPSKKLQTICPFLQHKSNTSMPNSQSIPYSQCDLGGYNPKENPVWQVSNCRRCVWNLSSSLWGGTAWWLSSRWSTRWTSVRPFWWGTKMAICSQSLEKSCRCYWGKENTRERRCSSCRRIETHRRPFKIVTIIVKSICNFWLPPEHRYTFWIRVGSTWWWCAIGAGQKRAFLPQKL